MLDSNKTTWPLPFFFARYIATSALRSRSPAVSLPLSPAMPMLALSTISDCPAHERLQQRARHARRDLARAPDVPLLDEHGELVPAQAGRRVPRADAGDEAPRDLDQDRVAGRVTEAVVHVLEVVEVDEEHRERPARAPRAQQRVLQPVAEQAAVRELRERVVEGLVHEPLLERLALVDAPEREDDAAAEVRVVRDALRPDLDEVPAAVDPAQPPLGRGCPSRTGGRVREQLLEPAVVLGVHEVVEPALLQVRAGEGDEALRRRGVVANLAVRSRAGARCRRRSAPGSGNAPRSPGSRARPRAGRASARRSSGGPARRR